MNNVATAVRESGREHVAKALNSAVLLLLIYFAVGAVCEITVRNEDYSRIVGHQQWLLTCAAKLKDNQKDVTEPNAKPAAKTDDVDADGCHRDSRSKAESASHQVRRFNSLNAVGVEDRCFVAAIFASPESSAFEDCHMYRSNITNPDERTFRLENENNRHTVKAVLDNGWLSYSGKILYLDQRPKEQLYLFLVLASAAIGSLLAGMRTKGVTTISDFAIGIGAGFAVYMLLRGGNLVFFTNATKVDALNPFSAAAAGLLVGLFSKRALEAIERTIPGATEDKRPRGEAARAGGE